MTQDRSDAQNCELLNHGERQEALSLSELDRAVFFDALIHAPTPNARLRRAFRSAEERVAS
jgi:uncharacterized protein (DUF1778 family)